MRDRRLLVPERLRAAHPDTLLAYSDRCFGLASRHFRNIQRKGFPEGSFKRWERLTDTAWGAYYLAGR